MNTGRYATIRKAFKEYKQNKLTLKNYPFSYVSGVDYTKTRVTPDKTQNGQEARVISEIDKKNDLERIVQLVEETVKWFEVECYGRERYIRLRLIDGMSEIAVCGRIGIAERTGRNWKRDIYEKAEVIAENLGVFQEKK